MEYKTLIRLVETMAAFINRSEATLSNNIVGHARFFQRLRGGKGCSVKSFNIVLEWFDANWPDDLDWPEDIERPSQNSEAA